MGAVELPVVDCVAGNRNIDRNQSGNIGEAVVADAESVNCWRPKLNWRSPFNLYCWRCSSRSRKPLPKDASTAIHAFGLEGSRGSSLP